MDWDDDSSVVPNVEEASTPEPPASMVTVSTTKWRLAKSLSAMALISVIGGGGFLLGHDVFTPKPIRIAAPTFTVPTFPSGGFGNGESPSVSPQNAKANAAAAKVASKVDPGIVDITTTFAGESGTAEGTGMILTSNGL